MNKIGIICASDTELEPFLGCMEDVKITEKSMLRFYECTIAGASAVAVYSGVCKVNAAIAAQILIDIFHVDMMINAGTAGAMAEGVELFDTVISEQTAYHDVAPDILTEFHPWMKTIFFPADSKLLETARNYSSTSQYPILFGRMVTGEQFIEDKYRETINRKLTPLSVDMETASIAHTCYVNRIPFIAVRTITDTASHKGIENFEKNCEMASRISAEVVMGIIKKIG